MRLTQHTDYSLRVLTYLALCEELATIQEISEAYGVSRNHLMKVVQKLVKAGYVESLRGQGGGLRLSTSPKEIGIGDVVRDMEPDIGLVECQRPGNLCVITPVCKLQGVLDEARRSFLDELDKHTLHDLLPRAVRRELIDILEIGD